QTPPSRLHLYQSLAVCIPRVSYTAGHVHRRLSGHYSQLDKVPGTMWVYVLCRRLISGRAFDSSPCYALLMALITSRRSSFHWMNVSEFAEFSLRRVPSASSARLTRIRL